MTRYRPNLVLFGDVLAKSAWENALKAVESSEIFKSVGNSQTVMPAALLPKIARLAGANVITMNRAT